MSLRWTANLTLWLSLLLSSLPLWSAYAHIPIPPKKGEIGRRSVATAAANFALVDQHGQPFRFADARGKWVLVTFLFTACPDVCPLLSAKFAAIQRAMQEQKREDYLLLSITTDPDRDTPAVLAEHGKHFHADFHHWRFLTGSPEQLAEVWKGFGVTVQRNSGGEVRHTALTTLIDRRGIRRIDYYGNKWEEREILKDISWLDTKKP